MIEEAGLRRETAYGHDHRILLTPIRLHRWMAKRSNGHSQRRDVFRSNLVEINRVYERASSLHISGSGIGAVLDASSPRCDARVPSLDDR